MAEFETRGRRIATSIGSVLTGRLRRRHRH
jgi:hypothetical protein